MKYSVQWNYTFTYSGMSDSGEFDTQNRKEANKTYAEKLAWLNRNKELGIIKEFDICILQRIKFVQK